MQGVIELIPTTGEAMACRSLGTTRGELRRQRLRALRAAIIVDLTRFHGHCELAIEAWELSGFLLQ